MESDYRLLSKKLSRYFEWHRCECPEDLAQEVIYRGLKRMAAGAIVCSEKENAFFLGIARNVVREDRKRVKPEPLLESEHADERDPIATSENHILLREYLSRLSASDRALLVGYILDGPEKAAQAAGISPNAIRIRVFRIRARIRAFERESPVSPNLHERRFIASGHRRLANRPAEPGNLCRLATPTEDPEDFARPRRRNGIRTAPA